MLDAANVPADLPQALTPEYLLHWRVVPVPDENTESGRLRVLASEAVDAQVLDDLRWVYGREPAVKTIPESELDPRLERIEHGANETAATLIEALDESTKGSGQDAEDEDLLARTREAPVVRLFNLLLVEALESRASDVHLEAGPTGLRARYRVDGLLVNAPSPPTKLAPAVVARLKVMADLDAAERRKPQDGRVRLRVGGRFIDVRVSTLPTLHGESVVLRLLEAEGRRLNLGELGLADEARETVEMMLTRPHGVLLATGPTGSGKTTTLYAALQELRTGGEKIVTVEDPVEYALDGIAQVPVNRKSGVSFASALRSILRQDPDVLLVGEMRDPETAEICTQAALTGHLVLSTLHTNDAPSALIRLVDLGIQPYLVASTVEGVVAQRLVRVNCPDCANETIPEPDVAAAMVEAGVATSRMIRSSGCDRCRNTGYRGRTAIYELLNFDDAVARHFAEIRDLQRLRAAAIEKGMRSLRDDGWRKVAAGVTTPEEVLRVTHA